MEEQKPLLHETDSYFGSGNYGLELNNITETMSIHHHSLTESPVLIPEKIHDVKHEDKSYEQDKLPEPPEGICLDFNNEIQSSKYNNLPESQIVQQLVNDFNQGRPSIMEASTIFGTRIARNQFRLVARNNRPELVPFSEYKMYKKPYMTGITEDIGIFNQTDLYFGAHGSHVINVPPGRIAKAWLGNEPIFLGHGQHVIHHQNFRQVRNEDLCNLSDTYIQHGMYHIIRVQQGTMAKAWLGTQPFFLLPKNEPYVIKDPMFKLGEPRFVKFTERYINHGNCHIIRVPQGHMAKAWLGTNAFFLKSRDEPYVFQDPIFRLADPMLVKITEGYIKHGTHHILRIPEGKVAKAWFGTRPEILEARPEPYVFNDQYFSLTPKSGHEYFENADEEVIIHGAIKRLLPKTGRVAITYDNGKLVTFGPSHTGKPVVITSSTHSFNGFLQINTQTLEFPSEKTREDRMKQGAKRPEDVNYEIFRTSDGLPVGVKLLVVYEITNPDATLHKLNQEQILPHIESLVVADMGMVIQNCSSGDFLKSNQTQARSTLKPPTDMSPSAPEFYEHMQDEVKNRLHDDFAEYGIKLVRLNIETPKILDEKIAEKMAEFSLMNSEARAKEAVLDRNFNIAQQEASQKAKTIEIEQQQVNSNKIAQAEADMNAVKIRAEAIKIEAAAKAEARLSEAQAEAKAQQMMLEVAKQRASIYEEYPGMLQYELAQAQVKAMNGINGMIISPELAANYYAFGTNNGLFMNPKTKNTKNKEKQAQSDEDLSIEIRTVEKDEESDE